MCWEGGGGEADRQFAPHCTAPDLAICFLPSCQHFTLLSVGLSLPPLFMLLICILECNLGCQGQPDK